MAFTRKTYTGPVKNRSTVARGGKKLADVSKEELDAFRKKAGNEDLSYKEALRKLLNADRDAKPAPKPPANIEAPMQGPAVKADPSSKYIRKLPDNRPRTRGYTFSDEGASKRNSEIIKPVDNTPKEIGEDGKLKNVNPVVIERRRLDPRAEAPEVMKVPGKADDTSLSLSERIKNARERARTNDTGTDKRSVSDRLKSAFGMAASMAAGPAAATARSVGKLAEKAKKEKGMKKGGSVRGDGIAKRGKTKGKMC